MLYSISFVIFTGLCEPQVTIGEIATLYYGPCPKRNLSIINEMRAKNVKNTKWLISKKWWIVSKKSWDKNLLHDPGNLLVLVPCQNLQN